MEEALIDHGIATTSHIQKILAKPSKLASAAANPLSKSVDVYDTADDLPFSLGYGHYLGLLAFRKQFGKVIHSDLEQEKG